MAKGSGDETPSAFDAISSRRITTRAILTKSSRRTYGLSPLQPRTRRLRFSIGLGGSGSAELPDEARMRGSSFVKAGLSDYSTEPPRGEGHEAWSGRAAGPTR